MYSNILGLHSWDVRDYILAPVAVLLVTLIVYLTRNRKYRSKIPDELIEERLKMFQPKPLIDPKHLRDIGDEVIEKLQPNEFSSDCLNLVKVNYYGFLDSKTFRSKEEDCIRKYGVGSCGPRGFYGTIDIHLNLEDRLAKFMGMEECVLYSYGFSTIASAIGAYCKRSDIIFCDEKISFCAKQGLLAAKGKEISFKHNDVEDLEAKMKEISFKEEKQGKKKPVRKFLIIEGIYGSTGQICPLPKMIELCKQYKVRIFIDETYSIGVLGKTGRGVTEHFGVDRSEVDMIMGSLESALASIGGFCVGASFIIEHQRLSGLGYCFSASLPPFLCQASLCALDEMEQCPEMFKTLEDVCISVDTVLRKIKKFIVLSSTLSPLKVITVEGKVSSHEKFSKTENIHDYCVHHGLYMCQMEENLQFHVHVNLTNSDVDRIRDILIGAIESVEC